MKAVTIQKTTRVKYRTVPTNDLEWAKEVIDENFFPVIKKQLDHLNKFLYQQRKIRAGLELNWMFDQEGESFHEDKEQTNKEV